MTDATAAIEKADLKLPMTLAALLPMDLATRGLVATAIMRAFASAQPTEDQLALRAIFDAGRGS